MPFSQINLGSHVPPVEMAGLIALTARTRANCLKRKVGCVFLDLYDGGQTGKVRSIGYNGFKSLFQLTDDCDRHFCNKRRTGGKNDALCFSPCAEIDAFRGYFHDTFLKETFYRQTTRQRDLGRITTAAVSTIEPCERCTSILFENGVFDFFPLGCYEPGRTRILKHLADRGRISVRYLESGFWKKW